MFDGKTAAAEVINKVRDIVAKSHEPMTAQLNDFDSRIKAIPCGPKGDQGDRGPAPDPETVQAAIDSQFKDMADEFVKGLANDA